MKKVLLLAVLLICYSNIFAFLTQGNWRWRNDDGSETSATWMAAQNTPPTISNNGANIRLRMKVFSDDPFLQATTYMNDTLQYTATPSDSASWVAITPNSTDKVFVLAGSASTTNVFDGEHTTEQITDTYVSNYTFFPGKIIVDMYPLKDTFPKKRRSEYEWTIKPTGNIQPNTTYYFREWGALAMTDKKNGTGCNNNHCMAYPYLKTGSTLAIKLSSFSLAPELNRVKIIWATSSEEFNNKFEIERSNDSRIWKTIGSIAGSGTSSATHIYQMYDDAPLTGVNYYRIRQYDINGVSTISEVQSIKMFSGNNSVVLVSPNPSKGNLRFSLQSFAGGDLVVSVTASNGKVLHTETIKSAQVNTTYTLNMSKPSAGIYVLNVLGQNLSEHIKVLVE